MSDGAVPDVDSSLRAEIGVEVVLSLGAGSCVLLCCVREAEEVQREKLVAAAGLRCQT